MDIHGFACTDVCTDRCDSYMCMYECTYVFIYRDVSCIPYYTSACCTVTHWLDQLKNTYMKDYPALFAAIRNVSMANYDYCLVHGRNSNACTDPLLLQYTGNWRIREEKYLDRLTNRRCEQEGVMEPCDQRGRKIRPRDQDFEPESYCKSTCSLQKSTATGNPIDPTWPSRSLNVVNCLK